MKTPKHIIRGRGAQSNPNNRFQKNSVEHFLDDLPTDEEREALLYPHPKTVFKDVFPRTIFNKVTSPDLPFSYSANPYQGCEHGCVYCYARNSHEYWGYSAGKDFEQIILVKNRPQSWCDKHCKRRTGSLSWSPFPVILIAINPLNGS